MIYLSIALVISVLMNGLFFWYNRQVIKNLVYILENAKEFESIVNEFKEHLSSVYNRDTFYGDPTLEGLLEHTKDMVTVSDEMSARIKQILDWDQE